MKRLIPILGALLISTSAFALTSFTTITYGSVATTNTYQLILPIANSNFRSGCTVQNTSTSTEYVYFDRTGTTPPASNAAAYQLAGGQSLNCNDPGGNVALDAIWITGTAGATYVVGVQ